MDDGKTLGLSGDSEVRYADVTSEGVGMNILLRLSGGKKAQIEPPLIVFTNKDRSYPIRGVEDIVPGVPYRSGPKGCMDAQIMHEWFTDRRLIKQLPKECMRVLHLDNCSGYSLSERILEAAEKIKTTICFFPPNTTDLNQPCDSFVIQRSMMRGDVVRTSTNCH